MFTVLAVLQQHKDRSMVKKKAQSLASSVRPANILGPVNILVPVNILGLEKHWSSANTFCSSIHVSNNVAFFSLKRPIQS